MRYEGKELSAYLLCTLLLLNVSIVMLTSSIETSPDRIIIEGADKILTYVFEYSTFLINVAKGVTSRIVIDYADSIAELSLYNSDALNHIATEVSSRVVVEYADSISQIGLDEFEGLAQVASVVMPRIIVEYADSVFTVSLKRPPLIGKLFSSLTISSLATSVSVNETFTVSGSISPPLAGITLTLTYTKPDETLLTRSVVTESDGSYVDSFKPDQTGRWEVKAIWIGDDTYYGAESSLIYFEVTPIIFALTIQTPCKGILIEVNGEKYVTDANGKVEVEVSSDSNVVNVKVEHQVLEADFRAIFTGWSDAETSNQRTLTINRNTILIANYNLQYYIAVKTSPVGIVDVSGSGWYDAGSTVTIETPPTLIGDKYEFRECIVNGESVGDKLPTIVMNKPYTITLVYYHVESLEILLPSGESTSATAATSSEIIKLIHTSSERKFTISIREQLENGTLEYLLPQALLMSYNSSTRNLMVRVNGEIVDFTVKPSGDDYLLTVTYASGQFQVDIYYVTYELIVNVKSWLLQQPIKDVSIQVLWSDETLFKSGVTDSRGMAKFDKLPSTNYIVKAEHQGQLFEWKGISLDQTKNLQLSFFVFNELLIFLVPAALVGVISPIILIPRRKLKRETERKIIQLNEKYRKESGGLALLSRVYLDLENLDLKDPKYVEKTLHRFEKKGLINGVRTYGRLKVVEFTTQLFTDDQRAILELTAEAKGRITREEIAIHTNWDLNRIESILKEFELHGIARREIINVKQIWIFEGLKGVKEEKLEEKAIPEGKVEATPIGKKIEEEKIARLEKIEAPPYQPSGISNESKITEYLIFLVDFLRKFVGEKTEEYYGEDWWAQGVPSDDPNDSNNVRKKCLEQREEYVKEGKATSADPLINFADLKDLSRIIFYRDENRGRNNWTDIFEKYYRKRKPGELIGIFTELYDIRTAIAHQLRKVSDEDVKTCEVDILKLLPTEEYKDKFRELRGKLSPNPADIKWISKSGIARKV